jgi:hypothetical protein
VNWKPDDTAQPHQASEQQGPAAQLDGPGHSDIFDRIAAGNDADPVALVAYGLYQRRKRAWIADFHAKNGHFPSPEERAAYSFGYREDALIALRAEAEGALATFAEQVIDERSEELRAKALDVQMQAVLTGVDVQLKELKSPWHHIKGHFIGFAALVGVGVFFWLVVNFEPTLEGVYHWLEQHLGHVRSEAPPAQQ